MSDLGSLSHCMVDSDSEAVARARRLRRKALAVSLSLEAVALAVMLIWPLVTPGVLPPIDIVTPLPPYHGGGGPTPVRPQRQRGPHVIHDRPPELQFHLLQPSRRLREFAENGAPDVGSGPIGYSGPGARSGPVGPLLPDGNADVARVEPLHETAPARPPIRQKRSEGVMAGSLIHRVDPVYPEIARAVHLSGEVRLRAIIATDGSVQHLEVLSGSPILARAAEDAVRQWHYRPTLLSGTPVEVETFITVNFILGQ